jgi:hypothetical protein
MDALLDRIRTVGAVFVDAYLVVDANRQVLDFNPHYRGFFSRAQARKLKGSRCCEYLQLGVCEGGGSCLAKRCLSEGGPVRFDEIPAQIEGEERPRQVIASAAPLSEGEGAAPQAALILLRDVSDQAAVQRKYKEMLDTETRAKERLRDEIVRKTKELMDANMELNRVQKELLKFKKGLFGS